MCELLVEVIFQVNALLNAVILQEDIVGGLNKVLELNWTSNTRLVVHIADAPCHGKKYHNERKDRLFISFIFEL
jgi:hypothetical protein